MLHLMSEPRLVMCKKMGKELPGVVYKPFDNELGQKIYDNISQEAWKMWLEHSKMIVNEYRIDLTSQKGQALLLEEAEKYFFGEGAQLPPDYKPPPSK
jgi:Fe-S cluster biosynthesis and repair protein YggX